MDWHFYPWVYQHGFAGISINKYPTLKKWLSDIGPLSAIVSTVNVAFQYKTIDSRCHESGALGALLGAAGHPANS